MTEREVEIQIESWRRAVLAAAPRGRRGRTALCLPIPRLALKSFTEEERAHLADCALCRKAATAPVSRPFATVAAPVPAVAFALMLAFVWFAGARRGASPVPRFSVAAPTSLNQPEPFPLASFEVDAPALTGVPPLADASRLLAVSLPAQPPAAAYPWMASTAIAPAPRAVSGPAPPWLPPRKGAARDLVWSTLTPEPIPLDAL